MRLLHLTLSVTLLCATARADTNVIKKDGTTQVAKSLRRQGETIVATVEFPAEKPGDPVRTGEIGIPVAQIEKIDFPEPAVLKTAPEMIVQAKAADALAQIDSAFKFYEGFRDAPGSWWTELALLKMNTLMILGRAPEAEALGDTVSRLGSNPESQRAGKVFLAVSLLRRGDPKAAGEALDVILKDSNKPEVLASAAIYRGQSCLALKDWENAILNFLQIPVSYPERKELGPASMLGVGRAHFGLEDFAKAKAVFKELRDTYPGTPEASFAKAEMDAIKKREKALADPGAPPPADERAEAKADPNAKPSPAGSK